MPSPECLRSTAGARTCHDDLGRDPGPCAGNLQRADVRRVCQLRGQPHIRDLGRAIRRNQHVARLQVQVHHPAVVTITYPLGFRVYGIGSDFRSRCTTLQNRAQQAVRNLLLTVPGSEPGPLEPQLGAYHSTASPNAPS